MIIYLFALILFNIFDGFQMILIQKEIVFNPKNNNGPAKYDFYFRAIDAFFDSTNVLMNEGCDSYKLYGSVECDLTISKHAWCFTSLSLKEKVPYEYYNLNGICYSNRITSKCYSNNNSNKIKQLYNRSKIVGYRLNTYCKRFNNIDLPYNTNNYYKRISLGSTTTYYTFVNFYFGEFEDYNSGVKWKSKKTKLRPKVSVKENIFTQFRFIKNLKVYAMTEIAVKVKCKKFYHGLSCWHHCEPSSKNKCKCTEKAKFTDQPCIITCDPMFVETYNYYKVADTKYKFRICSIIDYCKTSEGKKCKYQCFVINNNTGICTELKLSVKSNIQFTNITSNYVLNKETITIKPDEKIHNDLFRQITYKLHSKNLISSEILIGINKTDELKFTINYKELIDEYFDLDFSFLLTIWKKEYFRNFRFQIFMRPAYVAIFKSDHTPLGVDVESGSYYFCNASIYPPYFSLLFLSLRDFEVKPLPISHGQIPFDRKIIYGKIACNVSLIVPLRDTFYFAIKQSVRVKYKKDIAIEPVIDIFEKTNNIKCVPKSKYEDIFFYQVEGKTELNFESLGLNLTNVYDGLYKIGCTMIIRGAIRSVFKEFSVRLKLSEICFFVFAFVKGSIVQCGHNGLMPDEYRVTMKLTIPFKDEFNITNERFVKIPYRLEHDTYIGECFVSNIYNPKINMSKKIIIKLKNDIISTYSLEQSHKDCATNLLYMDRLSIKSFFRHSITLNHLLFVVKFNILDYSGDTLFVSFLIFILFSYVILVIILIRASMKRFSWVETVNKFVHSNKVRSLHTVLSHRANNLIASAVIAQAMKPSKEQTTSIDSSKFYFINSSTF